MTRRVIPALLIGHRKRALLPVRWGLLAFFDVGRVWLAGESSNTWHAGYGGGLMGEVLGLPGLAIRGTLAWSPEGGPRVYVGSGHSFGGCRCCSGAVLRRRER